MSQPFTDVEMMVLAQLSYCDPYIKAKGYNLSLYDMLEHEESYIISALGKDKQAIVDELKKKVQGKHYYIVDSKNDKHGTGFSALAIEGPDEKTLTVACRGTEGFSFDYDSSKDVYADAQLGFESQTNQQKQMEKFMEQFDSYDSIYLTGHSLGGNLAVSGALGYEPPEKIKGVVTFNCPGQNIDYITLNADRILELENRIKNYQNENDIVSDINIPIGRVYVIESNDDDGGVAYNHNQCGFNVSNNNDFTVVPGNKKSDAHQVGSAIVNVVVVVLDKADLDAAVYLLVNVVVVFSFAFKTVKKIANWIKKALKALGTKAKVGSAIQVDTFKLRKYAERLQTVNRRFSGIDDRFGRLYRSLDISEQWKLQKADMLTGYSLKLSRCISYLNDTATDFENVEASLEKIM